MNSYKLILLLPLLIFPIGCKQDIEKNQGVISKGFSNPLDEILGDKILDSKTSEVRSSNFHALTKIAAENLQKPSKFYHVKKLGEHLFLIQQKKRYSEARNFDLLVKTDKSRISAYYLINDFKVVDFKIDKKDVLLLCSNFENTSKYWKSENEIQILKIGSELKEIWRYSAKDDTYLLDAANFKIDKGKTTALVNLITGCHICYNVITLEMDEFGNCINAREVARHNSSVIVDQRKLDSIFMK